MIGMGFVFSLTFVTSRLLPFHFVGEKATFFSLCGRKPSLSRKLFLVVVFDFELLENVVGGGGFDWNFYLTFV